MIWIFFIVSRPFWCFCGCSRLWFIGKNDTYIHSRKLCQWLHYGSKAFCYQNIAWNLFKVPNYRIRNVENFNQTQHIYTYLQININCVLFKSACAFVNGQYMWNIVYLFHRTTRFLPKIKLKIESTVKEDRWNYVRIFFSREENNINNNKTKIKLPCVENESKECPIRLKPHLNTLEHTYTRKY